MGLRLSELLRESTLLALAMTLPPIAVLIAIELLSEFDAFVMMLWAAFAFGWTLTAALIYYKTRSPNLSRKTSHLGLRSATVSTNGVWGNWSTTATRSTR